MARRTAPSAAGPDPSATLDVADAAPLAPEDVLTRLGSDADGLGADEAARRLRVVGPNVLRVQRVTAWGSSCARPATHS